VRTVSRIVGGDTMTETCGSPALRDVRTTRDLLNSHGANYPDLPFLEFYDEIVTYKELDERTDTFADYLLKNGVKRGVAGFMAELREMMKPI